MAIMTLGSLRYAVQLVPLDHDGEPVTAGELAIDLDNQTSATKIADDIAARLTTAFEDLT